MAETKIFDPRALASITTGILLLDGFGKVHEAIEHVLGRSLWTHELPGASKEASAAVLAQFPDMPTECADWRVVGDAVIDRYGAEVAVRRGSTERTVSPLATARMVLDDVVEIIPVEVPK